MLRGEVHVLLFFNRFISFYFVLFSHFTWHQLCLLNDETVLSASKFNSTKNVFTSTPLIICLCHT